MDLNLEDFIPVYPDGDDPEIQHKLTVKQEFAEMASSMQEPIPLKGDLYLNQKLFIRFMLAYDRCLNISKPGAGKSCQIIGLREALKKTKSYIKHAYILQKPSTILQFKHQILCKCTNGEYETEMVKRAKSDKVRKSNATREIKKWYTITTYAKFASEIINGRLTDEQIVEKYSGCLFALDEAHVLRNEGTKTSDKGLSQIYDAIKRVLHTAKRIKVVVSTATPLINGVKDFARIANLALPPDRQLPETWDYNYVTLEQIEPYLRNHIFYIRSLSTGAEVQYKGVVMKGTHVMRYPDPDEKLPPIDESQPQPRPNMIEREVDSQVIVYGSVMGDIQYEAYKRTEANRDAIEFPDEEDEPDIVDENAAKRPFYGRARQASSFVYPDGSYGGAFPRAKSSSSSVASGIGKYINSPSENVYEMTPEFKAYVAQYHNLKRLSCKTAEIVRMECTQEGVGFAYTDIVSGSGAIPTGLCMEAYQCQVEGVMRGKYFTRFNEKESIFMSSGNQNRGVCAGSDTGRMVRPNFPKAPRYALLIGEIPDNIVDAMLEVLTSPENIDGEYIKFVIVSPVGRDGINIYHARRGHLITAGWHPSGMEQALARFQRAVSHDDLINRERERLKAEGKDPSQAKIIVDIYKHAALPPKDEGVKSIDVDFYHYAEGKSIPIHRIMRMLKQIDMGCKINYARNVWPTDVDGSEMCDYDKCEYVCIAPDPKDGVTDSGQAGKGPSRSLIDYSTYDILYGDAAIAKCMKEIVRIVTERGVVTFEELYDEWVVTEMFREKFIYMAVDRLLTEKLEIHDRFGFAAYLHTDGHNIYTQREFPVMTSMKEESRELAIYGQQVIGNLYTDFDILSGLQQLIIQEPIIESLKRLPKNPSDQDLAIFNTHLAELNIKLRVSLLEESIITIIKATAEKTVDKIPSYLLEIFKRYTAYILQINEPFSDILEAQKLLTSGKDILKTKKTSSQGKTSYKFDTFIGPPPDGTLMPNGKPVEKVYAHSLYSTFNDLTSYAVMANFRKANGAIRIYKVGWTHFRDANKYEFPAYNEIFQKHNARFFEPYAQFNVFGTIISDGKFRLQLKGKNDDKRAEPKGSACPNWKKWELVTLFFDERNPDGSFAIPMPDVVQEIRVDATREQIIMFLRGTRFGHQDNITSYSLDELIYLYKWFRSKTPGMTILIMCEIIKEYLIRNKRVLVI